MKQGMIYADRLLFDNASVPHLDRVASPPCYFQSMGDDDKRHSLLVVQALQNFHDLNSRPAVNVAAR